jgi:hypothetical protein
MKNQERPPELDGQPEFNGPAFSLLEAENAGLRRLVIELLEKNQKLREQLLAAASGRNSATGVDLHLVGGRVA